MLGQNLTDDSRICSTGDFDALQIFVASESFFAGELQGRDAGATTVDQRAIDVEKDEALFFFFLSCRAKPRHLSLIARVVIFSGGDRNFSTSFRSAKLRLE